MLGTPLTDEPYTAILSDDRRREGQTSPEGYVTEIDVPPGGVRLELHNFSHTEDDLADEEPVDEDDDLLDEEEDEDEPPMDEDETDEIDEEDEVCSH